MPLAGGRFARRLRGEDRSASRLALWSGPITNGEFVPANSSRRNIETNAIIRDAIDEASKRSGMDRRRFLQSAGAVAAALTVFDASASSAAVRRGERSGGMFNLPNAADVETCRASLVDKTDFIFDVHTHHVVPNGAWVTNAPATVGLVSGMLPAACTESPRLDCVDRTNYFRDLFLSSDTTLAMLTDVPNSGPATAPMPLSQAIETKQIVDDLTRPGSTRLLVSNIIAPNVGPVAHWIEEMTAAATTRQVSAFKVYTAWSPNAQGFSLENPRIGLPVVQHAHDLGIKVFVAHKGLPLVDFDPAFNHPDDMVAVSRQFPDMNFVIYHAAWDPSHVEGPYNPSATVGIDSLLSALERHNVPANDNVWVDLATVWRQLLTQPDQAAHAIGKLLKRVGEKRVMWGTDAIWYGSPQPQIMAMRAFEITTEFQERYGYPALTAAVKRDIFGMNAARLFHLNADARRCGIDDVQLAASRAAVVELQADGALGSPWETRGPTTRREMLRSLATLQAPWRPT
ncbi:MAG TPA: amidohydrolase family protein [Acidimicrobiales bacterium]|nr:amidohydrolase family protein [Acidimicrobiales bacterium]